MAAKKNEITSAMIDRDEYALGQRVCIVGRGIDAPIHYHGIVKRFTQTMMTVEYKWRRRFPSSKEVSESVRQRRYRTGRGMGGTEVGAHEYGGTYVAPRCQRPKSKA